MSRARDAGTHQLVRLGTGGIDAALAKDLERRPGRLVLLLPVSVRERSVLMLYGDHGDRDVELSAIGEVISFVPLVAGAFERLILKRRLKEKGADAAPASLRFGRVREPTPPLPNVGERTAALVSMIEERRTAAQSSLAPRAPELPPPPAPTPESPAAQSAPPPVSSSPTAPPVSAPPASARANFARPMISIGPVAPVSSQRPVAPSFPDRKRRSEPPEDGWDIEPARSPFSRLERGTKPGVGSGRPEPPHVESRAQTPPLPSLTPASPVAGEEAAPVSAPSSSKRTGSLPRLQLVPESVSPPALPDAPEIDVSADSQEVFDDELVPPSSDDGVPLAPASRSLAYSARPLPLAVNSQELRLPTVIVDLANDCRELVERLVHGDASAGDRLVTIGDQAITQLVSIFPGPLTSELRRSDALAKASECGPVLRTLARMGARPVPFVAVRTADGDPMVRAWATRLLGEMPSAEAAPAAPRRLTDEDADVRRAALAAGSLLLAHPEAGEALQARIAESVGDVTRPEESRHSLIEALAELRAPLVIPTLVRLLEDGSPDIVRSAHWALSVITRQDFGTKAASWEEWWLANSSRHRIEWLIDSLMHENQELRRTAGDELKSLTKEYFGYYDDLPKKERERAQERYRQWWESKGKARFR